MKQVTKTLFAFLLLLFIAFSAHSQNPLFIPPVLSGTTFNLNVQSGTTVFIPGHTTPTYGINGPLLAPTLIMNKGDLVTLNVTNSLSTSTTLHWHGMHLPAADDGGPHQEIMPGSTWSPQFIVNNNAATYWYHPHGINKTEIQVSKGIAGMIIVRDPEEAALTLPRTYGIDDIPLIVQTKAFDVLYQVATATAYDTVPMVNGTRDPFFNPPAQVVRFRLLNGSSDRSYLFGFSNGMPFSLIATDDGLIDAPVSLTRLRLSPGERAEILVDFSGMNGQSIQLMSYSSELPHGIIGADSVGTPGNGILDYYNNPLNGADFSLLQLNIGPATAGAITSIPSTLVTNTPWLITDTARTRTFIFSPKDTNTTSLVQGPFVFNGKVFNMDSISFVTNLGDIEEWLLINATLVAHPFHIHDVHFFVTEVNGGAVPADQQGKKDDVLVMPGQTLKLITRFEDYADSLPYMFHCHLLHHEDDGMMGQFIVVDPLTGINEHAAAPEIIIAPNPSAATFIVRWDPLVQVNNISVFDLTGRRILSVRGSQDQSLLLDLSPFCSGAYFVELSTSKGNFHRTIIRN